MSCACNPFYPSIDRLEQGKRRMSTTVTIDPRFHDAVIFDLDGVVTDTASIHAAAWAALFNDFLQRRKASDDEDHSPFTDDDYRHFVDGKARGDGVTDFLASRGISLPPGSASIAPRTRFAGSARASRRSSSRDCTRVFPCLSPQSASSASWPSPGSRWACIRQAATASES